MSTRRLLALLTALLHLAAILPAHASVGAITTKAGNELELEAANLKGQESITLDADKIIQVRR